MRRSRGIALISVLLVTVVVSSLAYHLVTRHSMTIAATKVHFDNARSRELNLAAELMAVSDLEDDWNNERSRVRDSLDEDWAQPTKMELEEGELNFVIIDSLSKFNLNEVASISNQGASQTLSNVIAGLELNPGLAAFWIDWVDQDFDISPGGAEDFTWLVADPPMRTPNVPVFDLSEIRSFIEMTNEEFARLRRVATVRPDASSLVNINTVDVQTLQLMDPTLSSYTIDNLDRNVRKYEEVSVAVGVYPELGRLAQRLTVVSSYFEVQSTITVDGRRSDYVGFLYRDPETGKVKVYERDFGMQVEQYRFPDVFNTDAYSEESS